MSLLTDLFETEFNRLNRYKEVHNTVSNFNSSYEALNSSLILKKSGFVVFLPSSTGIDKISVNTAIMSAYVVGINKHQAMYHEPALDVIKIVESQILYGNICYTGDTLIETFNFAHKLKDHKLLQ